MFGDQNIEAQDANPAQVTLCAAGTVRTRFRGGGRTVALPRSTCCGVMHKNVKGAKRAATPVLLARRQRCQCRMTVSDLDTIVCVVTPPPRPPRVSQLVSPRPQAWIGRVSGSIIWFWASSPRSRDSNSGRVIEYGPMGCLDDHDAALASENAGL